MSNHIVTTRVARSVAEVEALREPWMQWPGHRDSDIDFYSMILGAYPEMRRPHVIGVYRDGKPLAILVGRLDERRLTFNIGYLRAFHSQVRCLTFVYGAFHGDASLENTQALLEEVLASLKRGEADLASFEFVHVDSNLYRLATTVPNRLARDTRPSAQRHEILSVPENVEDIYNRMSNARRKHTKASIRKLQNHPDGKAEIVCYRNESELDVLFRDAEIVACKTYQRGLGTGFGDNPHLRMQMRLAADKGWLRAYVLYVGARPVAFWIGMVYGDTFLSEYMGYDPAFRQLSPGTFLLMMVIERFCKQADGEVVKQVDFGLGEAEYKAVFSTSNWLEARVYIFSPTLKGLTLKSMRTLTRLIDESARRVLASTNLMARLKRIWRDRLAPNGKTLSMAKRIKA